MNFKQATDALFSRVDHSDLANALGKSVALIRQARLRVAAGAHRSPPEGWREVVSRLAEERIKYFQRLIEKLADNR